MYYFASDMHLGYGEESVARQRERLLCRWLVQKSADAEAFFLVGDVFDFWYEYKRVVPKGFTRLLATLGQITERGIQVHFLAGNHDMWVGDYLSRECGVTIHTSALEIELCGRRVFVCHGDEIYARRYPKVRVMNAAFRSGAARWLFSHLLHPDCAVRFGQDWSRHNRQSRSLSHPFRAEEEPLVVFAREYLKSVPIDYFVFGHIHCVEDYPLQAGSRALFLGEWISAPTYAELDSNGMRLKEFAPEQ